MSKYAYMSLTVASDNRARLDPSDERICDASPRRTVRDVRRRLPPRRGRNGTAGTCLLIRPLPPYVTDRAGSKRTGTRMSAVLTTGRRWASCTRRTVWAPSARRCSRPALRPRGTGPFTILSPLASPSRTARASRVYSGCAGSMVCTAAVDCVSRRALTRTLCRRRARGRGSRAARGGDGRTKVRADHAHQARAPPRPLGARVRGRRVHARRCVGPHCPEVETNAADRGR
jgi:hypothetical protein